MRWTLLRHRMLHAASVGRVSWSFTEREWNIKSTVSTYVQMARAVNWLEENRLVTTDRVEVVPTDVGTQLLYEWDAKHGQVTQ